MDFSREVTVDDPMKWLNLILAALGSLAAFGALNKMHFNTTRPCIIGATLLIALGLAGQWLSLLHEEWLQYVDTALYGGILALLVASQRVHTWFLEKWANPISSAIAVAAGLVFLGGLLTGCAQAAEPSTTEIPVLTFEAEGIQANLMSGPCTNGQAAMAIVMGLPQFADRFKAIESTWPMQDGSRRAFQGCWAELKAEEAGTPVDVVIMVFEDRTAFAVPRSSFVKLRGQSGV
jgi:hypothetical protein